MSVNGSEEAYNGFVCDGEEFVLFPELLQSRFYQVARKSRL